LGALFFAINIDKHGYFMETILVKTLIDVSDTGVVRYNRENEMAYNQQKNWAMLLQTIGLRALIEYDHPVFCENTELRAMGFGEKHRGVHNVWTLKFRTDRDQSYANEKSPVGLLLADLHEVPIILNLTETINMNRPVFDTQSRFWRNTVVKLL
jgi:hypothetical protein